LNDGFDGIYVDLCLESNGKFRKAGLPAAVGSQRFVSSIIATIRNSLKKAAGKSVNQDAESYLGSRKDASIQRKIVDGSVDEPTTAQLGNDCHIADSNAHKLR